jgi:hypothetical protein
VPVRAPAKVGTQLRHRAWPRTDTSSDQATRQGRARSRPLLQEANGRADGCEDSLVIRLSWTPTPRHTVVPDAF